MRTVPHDVAMSTPPARRLRLAPHFAVVATLVTCAVLALARTTSLLPLVGAALYIGALSAVGHRARSPGWWPLQLAACNYGLLEACAAATPPRSGLNELTLTLPTVLLFGVLVVAARENHAARDASLAGRAERRFVFAIGLLPLEYAFYGGLYFSWFDHTAGSGPLGAAPSWLLGLGILFGIKLLFLLSNEWTVRQIRHHGRQRSGLVESELRPSADVPQIDLGAGSLVRVERDEPFGYRDVATTRSAVLGAAEASVRIVRARTFLYLKLWFLLLVPALIFVWSTSHDR